MLFFKSRSTRKLEALMAAAVKVANRNGLVMRGATDADKIEHLLWTMSSRIDTLYRTNLALKGKPSFVGAKDYRGPYKRATDPPPPPPAAANDTPPVFTSVQREDGSIIRESPPPARAKAHSEWAAAPLEQGEPDAAQVSERQRPAPAPSPSHSSDSGSSASSSDSSSSSGSSSTSD
jgi:hypothetical protein